MNDFNPFQFDRDVAEATNTDPRQLEKTIESTGTLWKIMIGTLWLLSALLTFGFGYQWLSGLFTGLFVPLFPTAGETLAGIAGGMFMSLTFDLGALIALYVYIYNTETLKQQDIAYNLLWVDFIGATAASIAQIIFGLSGAIVETGVGMQNFVGWGILVVTIGVFSFNLYQGVQFKLNSTQVMKATHQAKQRAEAIKRSQEKEEKTAEIMRKIAEDDLRAEIEVWEMANEKYKEERVNMAEELGMRRANRLRAHLRQREGMGQIPRPALVDTETEETAVMAATSPPDKVEVISPNLPPPEENTGENFTPPRNQ